MSTRGTWSAMPRFSEAEVPVGTAPPGTNAETGSSLPSWRLVGSTMSWTKSRVRCLISDTVDM
eukprot:639211-Rhodomonas_salina.5